ncbi:MAG: hypothetical protein ACXV5D_08620 [Halobacteriota archaeon]
MKSHAFLVAVMLLLVLTAVTSAGCMSTSNPSSNSSAASPSAQQQSNATGATPTTVSGVPTSVNGHEYTYYHNLNDRSTRSLCHANMR